MHISITGNEESRTPGLADMDYPGRGLSSAMSMARRSTRPPIIMHMFLQLRPRPLSAVRHGELAQTIVRLKQIRHSNPFRSALREQLDSGHSSRQYNYKPKNS